MDGQIEDLRRRAFALPSKDLYPNPAKALTFEMLSLLETARNETRQLQQVVEMQEAVIRNLILSRDINAQEVDRLRERLAVLETARVERDRREG